MINEIYCLSKAMEQANIQGEKWHRDLLSLPTPSPKAPCIRIVLKNKHIYKVESVSAENALGIRKYGSKQGTFPAMNLASLYRITDKDKKKRIADYIEGKPNGPDLHEIMKWCECNNWPKRFISKFNNSINNMPQRIQNSLNLTGLQFPNFEKLLADIEEVSNPVVLFEELESVAKKMLEQNVNISLAMKILFYQGNPEKLAEDDSGELSVVFDSMALVEEGIPTVSKQFSQQLNLLLLEADRIEKSMLDYSDKDAFDSPFAPISDRMPAVIMSIGEVILRTMNKDIPCQSRYGAIGGSSFPISSENRLQFQSALAWLSAKEQKEITWVNTDKGEVLLVYPENMPKNKKLSFTSCYKRQSQEARFNAESKRFIEQLIKEKKPGTDPRDDRIQIFILRKIDNARTKVVYTYNTTPREISAAAEAWSNGCRNLPAFQFGQPDILFPLEFANVLNRAWKQDGTLVTDKFKPFPRYYGMELFFDPRKQPQQEMYSLINSLSNLAALIGSGLASKGNRFKPPLINQVKESLSALGLYLFLFNVRKENYMQELPYLFGQLLKVSDELHVMYCKVVRNGDVPPQLAGSSFYSAACEQPLRAFAQLGQRMNPYITWAKHYRTKNIMEKGKESGIVGWYLSLYEQIASQLPNALEQKTRFNDAEKAELFIGYLAAFPKKEKTTGGSENE